MDRPDPPLVPLDALRALVRVIYPQRPDLADEIKKKDWFLYSKRQGIPPEEVDKAKMARDVLTRNVREHTIRLRGVLDDGKAREPHDIDPIDCAQGDLDIWEQTLEVTKGGRKTYRQVHCIADDVHRVAKCIRGERLVEQPLRPASEQQVKDAISAAYDAAKVAGAKPPNIVQLPSAVKNLLKEQGLRASGKYIQKFAKLDFSDLRRPRGRTVSSERRSQEK
jgi:hypothetical protein